MNPLFAMLLVVICLAAGRGVQGAGYARLKGGRIGIGRCYLLMAAVLIFGSLFGLLIAWPVL